MSHVHTHSSSQLIAGFAARHRRGLLVGAMGAVGVVALRLALPWPLNILLADVSGAGHPLTNDLEAATPLVAFVAIVILLGFADFFARMAFARFAIAVVRDLRAAAFESTMRFARPRDESAGTGDLISRLVSDTARLKEGLKGFLIHVATNGLLFIGVGVVLLAVFPAVGLVFLAAALVIGAITAAGALAIHRRASEYRAEEGRLADRIHRASISATGSVGVVRLNRSSGEHEAAVTRLQGLTTWAAHAVYGIAAAISLWMVVRGVGQGAVDSSALLLLVMYLLVLRAPVAQLARQGARTGKILAASRRVCELIQPAPSVADTDDRPPLEPLRRTLAINGVKVSSGKGKRKRRRMGPLDFEITAGERVLVTGGRGAGKSTLLRTLAGLEPRFHGVVRWDGKEATAQRLWRADPHILTFVPERPSWSSCRLKRLLDPSGTKDEAELLQALRSCDAEQFVGKLPQGLETKVSSETISSGERKAVALARAILHQPSLLLLDDPTATRKPGRRGRLLRSLFSAAPKSTFVIASTQVIEPHVFTWVIQLRRGRIVFRGSPQEWEEFSRAEQRDHQPESHGFATVLTRAEEGEIPCRP